MKRLKLINKLLWIGAGLYTSIGYAGEYYYDVKLHNKTGKYIDYSLSTHSEHASDYISEKFVLGKASKKYISNSLKPKYFEPDEISRIIKVKTLDGAKDYWSFSMNIEGHQRGQANKFLGSDRYCSIYREDAIAPVVVDIYEGGIWIVPYNSSPCSWSINNGYSHSTLDDNIPEPKLIYPTGLFSQSNNDIKTLNQLISTQIDTAVESSVGDIEDDGRFNYTLQVNNNSQLEQELNEEYYKVTGIRRASDPKARLLQADNNLSQDSQGKTWNDLKDILLDKLAATNPNDMIVTNLRVYDKDINYKEDLDFLGYRDYDNPKPHVLQTVGTYVDNNSDVRQDINTDTVSYTYTNGVSFTKATGWKVALSQTFKFSIFAGGETTITGEYNGSNSETQNQTKSVTYNISSKTVKVEPHSRKLVCSSLLGYSGEGNIRAGQKISGPIDIYIEEGLVSSDGTDLIILPARGKDFSGGYLMHFDDIIDLAEYIKDHGQTLPDWIEIVTHDDGTKSLYADIIVDANYLNIGVDAITRLYDVSIDEKRSAKDMCNVLATAATLS